MIERAGRVDPDDRYPDAPTMAAALDDVVRVLPPPGPFTLAGLGETVPDPHPTQVVTPRARSRVRPGRERNPEGGARADAVPPRPTPTGHAAIAPIVLGAVLILAIAGAVFALTRPSTGATVTVPNLKGMTEQAAQNKANRSRLLVSFSHRTADDPAGTVVSQHPDAGFFLGRGGTVSLVISKGPKPVPLPAVVGKPVAEAQAAARPGAVRPGAAAPVRRERARRTP